MSLDLNQFIDYTRSKPIRVHGYSAHIQASAVQADRTLLLVLQGRATHVRALWASFHEKRLVSHPHYFPRDDGKVYLSPNPTKILPQGVQIWIIHHDLTTTLCDHNGPVFYHFPPPHFGAMLATNTATPLLPHWQQTVFELGLKGGLIQRLKHTFNTDLYYASRDTEAWLKLLQEHRKKLPR